MTRRTSRPGLTLTEALVSLFVMALGLLSLLTLFPLGAMQMGQALKDDRAAQTAMQADGYMRMYWQHFVVEGTTERTGISEALVNPGVIGPITTTTMPPVGGTITNITLAPPTVIVTASSDHGLASGATVRISGVAGITSVNGTWVVTVMSATQYRFTLATATGTYTTGTGRWLREDRSDQPSYPVFVDPLGWQARTALTAEQAWISRSNTVTASTATAVTPRRGLAVLTTSQSIFRACCLTDDMSFQANGSPTSTVDWGAKYNWSAVVQNPRIGNPHVANLTILVFDGRPLLLGASNTELLLNASSPTAVTSGTPVSTVTFTLPAGYDPTLNYVRKGGWIMDGAITPGASSDPVRLANFYRIVGVNPTGPGAFTVDLETPLRTPVASHPPKFYLFAGLTEVFERPQLRPTSETP